MDMPILQVEAIYSVAFLLMDQPWPRVQLTTPYFVEGHPLPALVVWQPTSLS